MIRGRGTGANVNDERPSRGSSARRSTLSTAWMWTSWKGGTVLTYKLRIEASFRLAKAHLVYLHVQQRDRATHRRARWKM